MAEKLVEVEFVNVALVAIKFVKTAVNAFNNAEKKLVEVALVSEALVAKIFVEVELFITALLAERLVMVEEAAVVVENVEVPVKLAGEAVVNVPETLRLVIVALVNVAVFKNACWEFKFVIVDEAWVEVAIVDVPDKVTVPVAVKLFVVNKLETLELIKLEVEALVVEALETIKLDELP